MRDQFDREMMSALQAETSGVSASENLRERIDRGIDNRKQKEKYHMKRFSKKTIIAAAVIGCLTVSTAVFAAGKIAGISSQLNINEGYSYEERDKAQEEAGFQADMVESFSNGYTFDQIFVSDIQAEDEEGNVIQKGKELYINYKKSGSKEVSLMARAPIAGVTEREPSQTLSCQGITIAYYETVNKFVPPDYELTEEDKANMENPDYNFAYGTSEVLIQISRDVEWIKDGLSYSMLGFDLEISADELLEMAKEIIESR